jgi:hypothetical protein
VSAYRRPSFADRPPMGSACRPVSGSTQPSLSELGWSTSNSCVPGSRGRRRSACSARRKSFTFRQSEDRSPESEPIASGLHPPDLGRRRPSSRVSRGRGSSRHDLAANGARDRGQEAAPLGLRLRRDVVPSSHRRSKGAKWTSAVGAHRPARPGPPTGGRSRPSDRRRRRAHRRAPGRRRHRRRAELRDRPSVSRPGWEVALQ